MTMDVGLLSRVLWRLRALRARDRWTHDALRRHQQQALRALRDHAYAGSRFYRQLHRGLEDAPLECLPTVTKAQLMERFDDASTDPALTLAGVEAHAAVMAERNAADLYLGRYRVNATSGSTGRRGLFVFDRAEWAWVIASFARPQEWAGARVSLGHRRKTVTVASTTPWHMSSQVADTVRSPFVDSQRISAATPLAEIGSRLNEAQPEVLIAYASMMRLLADEALSGRLRIAPAQVFTSSEPLTEESRRRIEQAWGKVLFDQYATTECGSLAMECERHTGLHLAEDLTLVEVVDGDNRPVAPGGFGEKVLITALFSRTLPLIRYEISDSVRLAARPCSCGRPFALLDAVQGRLEDILELPGADGGTVRVHPHVFHRIMDTVPVTAWQVAQEPAALRLRLAAPPSRPIDTAALVAALRSSLAAQGVAALPIEAERVDAIPRTASGKAPLVVALRPAAAAPAVSTGGGTEHAGV
ncbi:MAG TPA: phenylacetate--CoA ligase family protein [Chloroflexota bacterium]|nr:phenylacetate--CoA ligase family protein [Chloroflexota bacterium]